MFQEKSKMKRTSKESNYILPVRMIRSYLTDNSANNQFYFLKLWQAQQLADQMEK